VVAYRPIFVLGEVNRPGQYPYQPGMTAVTAVAVGGGFTYRAVQKSFSVVRTTGGRAVEARADRQTFLQQYGFNWGFRGTLDPSVGTGTGLVFPSRVDVVGGPFEFAAGNPVLSFSLGNVLGTFTLDVALNAAEQESAARVIAARRILAQVMNDRARRRHRLRVSIQSVQQQAVENLRAAILAGVFKPGDRLIEADLCRRVGVSRPSLREALRSLEGDREKHPRQDRSLRGL